MRSREVTIPAGGGAPATPAYFAAPEGAPRYGVVVVHEMFGRRPEIDRACDRIARAGAAAVGPDLLAGGKLLCLYDLLRSIKSGKGTPIVHALNARAWLAAETGLGHDRIALLGFCAGGGFALAAGRGWAAVSTNYGQVPEIDVLAGIGPVIGCYGGRDKMFGANMAKRLDERLTALGVKHEVHVMPEAGHSFLTDAEHPIARVVMPLMALGQGGEDAREAGWQKIFAFFDGVF